MNRKSTTTIILLLINLQYFVCATKNTNLNESESLKHLTTDLTCIQECNGQPYGYKIQDPYDCTGYLLCHDSVVIQQYCASGYIFNMIMQKCIQGKCPPCVHITPPPITTPPPTIFPPTITPSPCTNPNTDPPITLPPCTNPNTNPPITPPPTIIPPPITQPPCIDPDYPDCTKVENGYRFPHNTHCRFFWQCLNNQAVLLFCEKGMWYDREHFVCNFPFIIKNCSANQD